ncbi:hypothetical protein KIW84_065329 [Lathyrus oleraceus]|uniref:Uncharacterized protein n=1 Tax=Pisum sativum TaxID=3888 RepID=A0A9D4WF16_PEA|nr:hypothetical protein KIW84_065329 [Pisum sativum]
MVGGINELEDFRVDEKKYPIRFVEDLEFSLKNDTCFVEYEEENESQGTQLGCKCEYAPLVDNLMNQLHDECPWSYEFIKKKEKVEDGCSEGNKLGTSHSKQKNGRCLCKSSNRILVSSILYLKRVEKLSTKYRFDLILSLKVRKKKKLSSSSSRSSYKEKEAVSLLVGSKASGSNEDWKNWMVVHGKPQEVVDDFCVIGKSIGLNIKGVLINDDEGNTWCANGDFNAI